MNKNKLPEQLVLDILERSNCAVKMGAVLADKYGIFSWGWNYTRIWDTASQHENGMHAEVHAIERANPKRLKGATIYVAGRRTSSGNIVESKPCENCMAWIQAVRIDRIVYLDKTEWRTLRVDSENHERLKSGGN